MNRERWRQITPAVRPAAAGDVSVLADVLARAFHDDPVDRWLFPNEAIRARRLPRLFSALLRQQLRHGTVLTTAGDMKGAALWESPRGENAGLLQQIELFLRVRTLLGRRSLLVARGTTEVLKQRPAKAHWYLETLGTDPVHQGEGVGAALMKPIFDRCDAEQLPAYLEASREENVPYYQRHGFVVVGQIHLPRGPTIWRMLREPQEQTVEC